MDLYLPRFPPSSPFRRRRNWLLLLAGAGITGYGVYRIYHLPSVTRKRRNILNLLRSLVSMAEAIASSSETISIVSADLNRFLNSDSDEIPNSIKQLSKIAASHEFLASVSRVSEALTVGVCRGFQSGDVADAAKSDILDRILVKVFSTSGSGFVSVVAGNFARGLVMGFYESGSGRSSGDEVGEDGVPCWVSVLCSDKSRKLIGECIQKFVGSAVTVYLEKTMNINTYDAMFSGITHPKHEAKMKELLVSVCNGAVETLVKTSHEVLTSSNMTSSTSISVEENGRQQVEFGRSVSVVQVSDGGGWVDRLSSTLATPSNRKFVLDMTGRVTFDTVRSFLDFMLCKFGDSARSSASVVREEIVGRGLEVVRYVSAKSMLVLTICLSFCLHLLPGTRFLVAA